MVPSWPTTATGAMAMWTLTLTRTSIATRAETATARRPPIAVRVETEEARKNGNRIKVAEAVQEAAPTPAVATPEVGAALEALEMPELATGRPQEMPVPGLRPEMLQRETEPLPETRQPGIEPLLEMPERATVRPRQVQVPASQVVAAVVVVPAPHLLPAVPQAAAAVRSEVRAAAGPAPAVQAVVAEPAAAAAAADEEGVVADEHEFETQTIFYLSYEDPSKSFNRFVAHFTWFASFGRTSSNG